MKIINIKKTDNTGKLKAFFDLETSKLTIYGCKLLEGREGVLWAAMPSRQYEHEGQKKWQPIVTITDEELLNRISVLARSAYEITESDKEVPF